MDGYKCYTCLRIIKTGDIELDGEKPKCPICGEVKVFKKMCPMDTGECRCAHDTHAEVKLCPTCRDPVCPECGSHDVVGVSRVTGYLSDVAGWRASKRAELEDRIRYDVGIR